jgi:hypothetical protein
MIRRLDLDLKIKELLKKSYNFTILQFCNPISHPAISRPHDLTTYQPNDQPTYQSKMQNLKQNLICHWLSFHLTKYEHLTKYKGGKI